MKAMSPSKTLLNVRVSPEKKGGVSKTYYGIYAPPYTNVFLKKKSALYSAKYDSFVHKVP